METLVSVSRHKTVMRSKTTFLIFLSVGLVIAAVGAFFRPVRAQTWVEGHITTDTTWTVADSPYRAINDVIVDPGVLLTIEPGVEMQFADGFSLVVEGSLNASGTELNPIVFTSSRTAKDPPDPYPGAWNTLKFKGNSSEKLLLKNVRVEYATHGVTIESSGLAKIDKSEISKCSDSGIMLVGQINSIIKENTIQQNINGIATVHTLTHAGIIVVNNTISNNQQNGIYLCSSQIYNVSFSSNSICSNGKDGIYVVASGSNLYNVSFSSNSVSLNGKNGICLGSNDNIHNILFSSNSICSNGESGIFLQSFYDDVYNVLFSSNSIFLNGKNGIYLQAINDYVYNVLFSSNTISSNAENGIYANGREKFVFGLAILDNIISANHQEGIYLERGINANISRNTISYNLHGVFFSTQNNLANYNDIYYNSYGMNVTSGATVNAEYNYWGHSTGPYHESINFDGKGNPVNGDGTDLDFIPFLTSPVGTINQRPVAVLDVDRTNPNIDETVTFDGSSSIDDGRIDYYFFDFGDGTNSSWTPLSVVTHKYSSEGSYTATLIVMDDFGVTSLDGDLLYTEITVVPEFPTVLILPLFMLMTLIVAILVKKRPYAWRSVRWFI